MTTAIIAGIVGIAVGAIFLFLYMRTRTVSLQQQSKTAETNLQQQAQAFQTTQTELRTALDSKARAEQLAARIPDLERQVVTLTDEKTNLFSEVAAFKKQSESDAEKILWIEDAQSKLREAFSSLAAASLKDNSQGFLNLAQEKFISQSKQQSQEIESKKSLIDQQLKNMTEELGKVKELVSTLEKDRIEKFGQLDEQLKATGQQTYRLLQTTNQLKEALASTKIRGQWGERMAEDVLRVAGFVENVNYRKQSTIASSGQRPDYTFLLPRNLIINMDVKFPLENYLRFLESEASGDHMMAEGFRKNFLRDVKSRIKEVAGKEYINPGENTLDYVLLFIPNEQIYAFIHEQEAGILDEGLKQHVVFCSPITLFAVLAVIRQAVDNFSLEMTSRRIQNLLHDFSKQWYEFKAKMDMMGKRIKAAQNEYDELTTTRTNKLEKPLRAIEALRLEQGLDPTSGEIPPPPIEG
jgi:DNA recombination protein RmuC